jgi:SPP1 gp7 family putative phage head morphogenesis protein
VTALAEHDAVQGIKDALGEALKNGETFKDFQARIADIIAAQGWKGDRIETIFRNNLQTAYAAGRYAKMQQVRRARPYWQYITVGDERVRPSHAILHERVFPADHEFWAENYPPNGHRCRCAVRTLSARQVEKEGLEVETDMPGDGMWTDPKTGMEYHVAFPGADDGWRNNPGQAWQDDIKAGLPLERRPELTPESYAEQRLRPKPVKDFTELKTGIQDKAGAYLKNSKGFTGINLGDLGEHAYMSTNSMGTLNVSNRTIKTGKGDFNAYNQLQNAWNNIAAGKALNWHEEYAIESLWHEITHNTQVYAYLGKDTIKRRVSEIVTQWTARRTYPDFLKSLGGKAAHLESIKLEGIGYGHSITLFDRLLAVLKIDEAAMLAEMKRLLGQVRRDTYQKELAAFLAKRSGRDKKTIKKAISAIKDREWEFEEAIKKLQAKK